MLYLLAWLVCFSTAILLNKFILQFLPPILFVGLRMLVPAVFLLCTESAVNLWECLGKVRQYALHLILIILCTTFFPLLCKSFALKNLPVSKATLIGTIDPFVASFYAFLFWQEQLNIQKICALFVVLAGTVVLIASKSPLEATLTSFGIFSIAEIAALSSVFIGKLGWIYVSRFVKTEVFSSKEINVITMFGAGIIGMVVAGLRGEFVYLTHLANVNVLGGITIAITFNAFGYFFFTDALRRFPFTTVSITGCLIPVFVTAGGYLFFGELITLNLLISACLIFSAIVIFRRANVASIY
jgi:drug/metabolite transporter (DMT)-like permease